jgi:multidrug resistance efflux pump
MANELSPQAIADSKTLEQIDAKIAAVEAAYDKALENKRYRLNDMQGDQEVEQHKLSEIAAQLNAWLRARKIKTGNNGATFTTIQYTGKHY